MKHHFSKKIFSFVKCTRLHRQGSLDRPRLDFLFMWPPTSFEFWPPTSWEIHNCHHFVFLPSSFEIYSWPSSVFLPFNGGFDPHSPLHPRKCCAFLSFPWQSVPVWSVVLICLPIPFSPSILTEDCLPTGDSQTTAYWGHNFVSLVTKI